MLEEEIQTETTVEPEAIEETPQIEESQVEEPIEPTDKREGILDYIKGALKSAVSTKEPEENTEEETVPAREVGKEVPSEFLEAAKADGWSTADIAEFSADKTDEELLELIPHLTGEEEEEIAETEEPEKDEPETPQELNQDIEALKSSIRDELRKELLAEYGPKLDVLDDFRAENEVRQKLEVFETANQLMDEASKDNPIFGTFEDIPRFAAGPREGEPIPTSPEYKARREVFNLAISLMSSGRSQDVKDAMSDALAWHRGKYGQKQMERKVIRNLKQHEKKLSGARTGKETKKEFDSSRDEILDYIASMQKAAGS